MTHRKEQFAKCERMKRFRGVLCYVIPQKPWPPCVDCPEYPKFLARREKRDIISAEICCDPEVRKVTDADYVDEWGLASSNGQGPDYGRRA